MPLPQGQEIRYHRLRVRKRRRRSWDHPRHFMLSVLLGTSIGLLMSFGFLYDYATSRSVVQTSAEAKPAKCPPVNCCLKPD